MTATAIVATLAGVLAAIERSRSGSGGTVVHAVPGVGGKELLLGPPQLAAPTFILLGIALTTAPLAFRRRYPITAFCVIMIAVIATSNYTTTVTFATVILAAYSAVVYSKFRRMALLSVSAGAIIVTAAFPNTTPPVPAR